MITHSEGINTIMGAILAVQQSVHHVDKNAQNPHFGSNYTTLDAFLHALRGPMAEQGIVMVQGPGMDGGHLTLTTFLHHPESGEWIQSVATSPLPKADPQGVGSAITYLRRYSLAALFAVPQEDDDGNAATPGPRQQPATRSAPRTQSGSASTGEDTCPKCAGKVWDNRPKKASGDYSPKSPDYSCRDKDGCGWVFWIDGAQEELKKALHELHAAGAIKEGTIAATMDAVAGGDLAAFRIAQDYVNAKRQAAS